VFIAVDTALEVIATSLESSDILTTPYFSSVALSKEISFYIDCPATLILKLCVLSLVLAV
jgi:hypothetical protein